MGEQLHAPRRGGDRGSPGPATSGSDPEGYADDEPYDGLLTALDRASDAYRAARTVYDRYPAGLPDELSAQEQALLDGLERAEAALRRLRTQRRDRV